MSRDEGRQTDMETLAEEFVYPEEALNFVQEALGFTVDRIHGQDLKPGKNRHVSGRELCLGLRDYALARWGKLSRMVLRRWNINSTLDFGRIVFQLVARERLKTTEQDTLEDFRDVFDFHTAFETGYRIEHRT